MNTELLKLRILVAVQDLLEYQFLYANVQFILEPHPLSANALSLRLLWQRHCFKVIEILLYECTKLLTDGNIFKRMHKIIK